MLDPDWKSKFVDGGALTLYNQGMSLLLQSGVLDVLEAAGRPLIIKLGADVQVMAAQAARSAGYNEALLNLINFRAIFLDPKEREMPLADFGGIDALLSTGAITEKEANDLRSGRVSKTA